MRPNESPLTRSVPLDSKGRPRKQCCEFHRSGGKRSLWCGDQSIHDDGCPEVGCEDPTCPFRPGAQPAPTSCPYPEEFDGTDGACPAFWRGHDSGGAAVVEVIKRALTGTRHSGTYASPALTEAVDSIYALKARLATLEQRLRDNEERFRWAKAREDEAKEPRTPAIYCDHANEVPLACPCADNCYCKDHTCSDFGTKLRQAQSALKVVGSGWTRKGRK